MDRIHALLDAESASTATTKTLDIDINDPISQIVVQMKGTNNGSTPTAVPAKMIKKIEIVDGSDVIASVSGIEAEAANILDERRIGDGRNVYIDNIQAIFMASINFGRFLGDKEYALDPSRFKNPQLKITHDKALGGSAPDAATLSVFAHIMENTTKPKGLLSLKEIFSWSLTSSAEQKIDLPTTERVRKLIFQSLAAGKQPWEQYNKLKLYFDSEKKVILNGLKTSDLIKFLRGNPFFGEVCVVSQTGGQELTAYITPTLYVGCSSQGIEATAGDTFHDGSYGGQLPLNAATTGYLEALVRGKGPHGAMGIPFGDPLKPEEWLDPKPFKEFAAKVTAGSSVGSSSTCEVVAETERIY